jgi:ankyrin repeat protein
VHRASWRSEPKVVELLIDAGADLAATNSEGLTPLMKFALSIDDMCNICNTPTLDPRLEVLKMVLDRDDNIYAVDKKFRTALHVLGVKDDGKRAYRRAPRRLEAAKLLIRAGIPVDAVDGDGRTAMDIFSNLKDFEMVQLLSEESVTSGYALKRMAIGTNNRQV